MTGPEFSEVDFDLLADYVGGALDGTPEEAVVARRVAEEPAWREAHAALTEATGSVHASLAAWGEAAEPMPAEVADRIATALEQEPHRPALVPVPGDADGPRRSATKARRRLPAWAAPATIAAGVVALAGFGLSQAGGIGGSDDSSAGSADAPVSARENAADGRATLPFNSADGPVVASGQDYRQAGLSDAAPPPMPMGSKQTSGEEAAPGSTAAQIDNASPLGRLRDPVALGSCVSAIGRDHPPGVGTVEVVDLATFEGSPAVIVFFTDGSGARWVWASGPECGQAARGADTRASAKIG
ncbi:hypothetical protein [Phytohabitans kaempferiae]|uniref:Anti-sigma factor n=1 Tax=Phytohabitans kaempferiae TaxID=1620943 RepID=A0ABV6MDW9_9ACTN